MLGFFDILPPIMRRYERWFYLTVAGLILTFGLFDAAHALLPQSPNIDLAAMVLLLTVFVGWMSVLLWSIWGTASRCDDIRRKSRCLCGRCGFDLADMSAPGACPECGVQVDPARLRLYWDRFLRHSHDAGARPLRRQSLPPWMRRVGWSSLALVFVIVAALAGLLMTLPPGVMMAKFMLLCFACPIWIKTGSALASFRVCRRVTERDGLVCLQCGGDLKVEGADTECVKCHARLAEREVRAQWEEWKPPCWNIEGMDADQPPVPHLPHPVS